jgi:hypothetical protein
MATFKIEDLMDSEIGRAFNARELAAKNQEGTKRMVGRRDKRPLAESEVLIKTFILGAEEPVTMLQICDHIGRKPSPQFRAVVDRLVATGQVAKAADQSMSGNLPRFWYWRP